MKVKDKIKELIRMFADGDDDMGIWGHDTQLFETWGEAIREIEEEVTGICVFMFLEELEKKLEKEKKWADKARFEMNISPLSQSWAWFDGYIAALSEIEKWVRKAKKHRGE